MSDIGALVERLVEAGLSVAEASEIIVTAVAAGAASASYRRTPGAIRTERWREKNKRHKASQSDVAVTADGGVTERHKASQSVTCDDALLISKKDINKKERKKAVSLSDAWEPRPPDRDFAVSQLGEAASIELQKFRDHARMKGRVARDWDAAWRNWVRQAVEYRGGKPVPDPPPENNGGWKPGMRTDAEIRAEYAKQREAEAFVSPDTKPENAGVFREGGRPDPEKPNAVHGERRIAGMRKMGEIFRPDHWGSAGRSATDEAGGAVHDADPVARVV